MKEREVLLNALAQGLRPMSEGIEWFEGLGQEEQSEAFEPLLNHLDQDVREEARLAAAEITASNPDDTIHNS
ncbi:DUF5958 family protein [Streptomyces cadmiisoli]|uniref:DUF5958 family protein n=1 Tax=Streptomyces cadmiisoli TaxID=2184053 RepID=UPI00366618AB